jgi:hypothetical protein
MAFPRIRRSDFSHSLVHLTKNRKDYEYDQQTLVQKLIREVPAFDVLKEILVSGTIRGSGNEGYVKGDRRAVVSVGNSPVELAGVCRRAVRGAQTQVPHVWNSAE